MTRSLCLIFLTVIIYNLVDVVQCNCSAVCTSCDNGKCKSCQEGSYLEAESCQTCPGNCTSCVHAKTCSSCAEGYFGVSCAGECHVMCLNNTCHKDNGFCTHECIEGYFGSGASCIKCNDKCKTCITYANTCVVCKDGLYGPSCQNNCSHCKDSLCTKDSCTNGCGNGFYKKYEACSPCNAVCTICETFHNCTVCEDGYFGSGCHFLCRDCTPCNKEDGLCRTTMRLSPVTTKQSIPPNVFIKSSVALTQTTSLQPLMITTAHSLINSSQSLDVNTERENSDNPSVDKIIIIYAASGGGGGFIVLAIVAIVVTKRRLSIKQTNEGISSQINEERDGASQDYTTLAIGTREEDGHLYSILNGVNNSITMETRTTACEQSGQINFGRTGRCHYVNVN